MLGCFKQWFVLMAAAKMHEFDVLDINFRSDFSIIEEDQTFFLMLLESKSEKKPLLLEVKADMDVETHVSTRESPSK